MTENELAKVVVDAACKIHEKLGAGLLGSVDHAILVYELRRRPDQRWDLTGRERFEELAHAKPPSRKGDCAERIMPFEPVHIPRLKVMTSRSVG